MTILVETFTSMNNSINLKITPNRLELIYFEDFSEGISIDFNLYGENINGIFKNKNSEKILNIIKKKKEITISGYFKDKIFVCKRII